MCQIMSKYNIRLFNRGIRVPYSRENCFESRPILHPTTHTSLGPRTRRVLKAIEPQSPGAVRSKIQRTGRLGGQIQRRGGRTGAVRSPMETVEGGPECVAPAKLGALLAGGERRWQVWSGYAGYGGLAAGEVAILT
jgi:hypothetical protein